MIVKKEPQSLESFKPQLRQGRIHPQGAKFVFETDHPYDQIVLPNDLMDFMLLCSGKYSVREIVEKLYQKLGTVHFKSLIKAIYVLQERGFFVNGHELATSTSTHSFKDRVFRYGWDLGLKWNLIARITLHQAHPIIFYCLSLIVLVSALGSVLVLPAHPWVSLQGSEHFVSSVWITWLSLCAMLNLRNLTKSCMLLLLTGKAYNLQLRFGLWGPVLHTGNESFFLIEDKLFLTMYHATLALTPFAGILLIHQLAIPPETSLSLFFAALALLMADLNPFRPGPLSRFYFAISQGAEHDPVISQMSTPSFQTLLLDPRFSRRYRQTALVFSILSSAWLLTATYFIRRTMEYTFTQSSDISSATHYIAASYVAVALLLAAIEVSLGFIQLVEKCLINPIKKETQVILRKISSSVRVGWNQKRILQAIQELPLFGYFSESLLRNILIHSTVMHYRSQTPIIIEGDIGRHLYVLLKGEVLVRKRLAGGEEKILSRLLPTTIFGETAVIEEVVRTADVISIKHSDVLQIPAEVIRLAARHSQHIREIENFKNAIMVNQFFTSAPMFRDLPEHLIHLLTMRSSLEFVEPSQIIFQQGAPGDYFYMIIRGSVNVIINDQLVKKIKQGGFFGEIAVIASIPRTATVAAAEPSVLLKLSADSLWEILVQHVEMGLFIEAIGEMRLQQDLEFLKQGQAS